MSDLAESARLFPLREQGHGTAEDRTAGWCERDAAMDEVVDLLAGLDYPDGITGGLRRTADMAR